MPAGSPGEAEGRKSPPLVAMVPKTSQEGGGGALVALLERRVPRGDGKEKVAGSGVSVVLAQVFGGLGFGAATESKLEFINIHECHTTGLL